jgi:methylenetetrahydrofolate reductase (NADPH)
MALALRPLFVTVTWGAGGSTSTKSLQLAEICQRDLNLTTCLHLTCTNMSKKVLDGALESAKKIGIRNILALRGDPPRNEEYFNPKEEQEEDEEDEDAERHEFVWAIDLVRYIREEHGDYFCIGVAAYPEGYAEGTCPEHQDPKRDLPYLIDKVKAGADFIMTQLFYDVDKYISFEAMLRADPSGVFKDITILPGLMPIQSYPILRRTTKLSNASLPQSIQNRLEGVKGDDAKVKALGVDILAEIVTKLRAELPAKPLGFHFYTLNLEKVVSFVLERCGLIPEADEGAIIEDDVTETIIINGQRRDRRTSSLTYDPNNHLIVDKVEGRRDSTLLEVAKQAGFLQTTERPDVALAISEGEGTLGREATWDDFPNGRFGDARSPAFGDIDGYGPSLHMSHSQAQKLWGFPVAPKDISTLFVRHITGDLDAIPWSEQALNEESKMIQNQLVALNRKGWWTVASQPAVNCCRSDDPTFGWGPKGGFVFQKAFVEFFCPAEDLERIEGKLREMGEGAVSFYAANDRGEYRSNMPPSDESLNAVTWGVFIGKE